MKLGDRVTIKGTTFQGTVVGCGHIQSLLYNQLVEQFLVELDKGHYFDGEKFFVNTICIAPENLTLL